MNDAPETTIGDLVMAEVRRALHRRAVWVLLALAAVGIVLLGVVAFADSAGKTVLQLRTNGTHPAVMADWWIGGGGDGTLMIGAVPLLIGGFFGGATVAGAEWRAGTVSTLLGWEPRRRRLHTARLSVVFGLAALIGLALEGLFLAATLPAVLVNGSTAGVDGGWWLALAAAALRIAVLTGAAAAIGASFATLGRGTAFALAAAFAWLSVGENLVRGLKPSLEHLLFANNLATVLTWAPLDGVEVTRSEVGALATVVVYVLVLIAAGAISFTRRDISGAS